VSRRRRRALLRTAVAIAVAAALPGPLAAQACAGTPTGPRGWSVSALGGVADHDGTVAGLAIARRFAGESSIRAGYARTTFGEGAPARDEASVAVAHDVSPSLSGLPPALSLCPMVEVRGSWLEDVSVSEARLGAAAGWAIEPGGSAWTLHPSLSPLLVLRRASFANMTDRAVEPGLRGALVVMRGRIGGALALERVWTSSREDRAFLSVALLF